MQALLIATHNPDKLAEIRQILQDCPVRLLSMADFPRLAPPLEDKDSIEGNAMKKAREISAATGLLCLADDTGLFIDALDGAPGVYAARFAGEGCSYQDNRIKALQMLEGKTERKAEFRTAMALAAPDGIIALQLGSVRGSIATEERGEAGFGYDSIFIVESLGKTFGEISDAEKHAVSHRGKALEAMLPLIRCLLTDCNPYCYQKQNQEVRKI